jgi:hypothetical protein
LHRSFAVAPPPVRIGSHRGGTGRGPRIGGHRTPPAPPAAPPPVPAVAGGAAPGSNPGGAAGSNPGGPPSALYAAAAALFGQPEAAGQAGPAGRPDLMPAPPPVPAAANRGTPMSEEVARRISAPSAVAGEPGGAVPATRQLDELVDLVVERIEQRVVDELERRGRRGTGGF